MILDERFEVHSATPGVERRLAELPDGDVDAGRLPTAVMSVAARALREDGGVAVARVLSRGGPGPCCTARHWCRRGTGAWQ